MKIFTCEQIRQIDEYTILHEPVTSADLMERAAGKIFSWLTSGFSRSDHFLIFTGPGNNGGDGLALARMLVENRYIADVFHINTGSRNSPDWEINRKKLESAGTVLTVIGDEQHIPVISSEPVIIDAIFGSGLSRPVEGLAKTVIQKINRSGATIISVDIPSGLFCEDNNKNDSEAIIRADHTLTFQFPKLAFMFPENYMFAGEWHILDIGLHPAIIRSTASNYNLLTGTDIIHLLHNRKKFDHKGNYGHGLLVAGSYGKMGAAVLSAGAALRTGIGLLTCHIPRCGYAIMQSAVPEAMALTDSSDDFITSIPSSGRFSAIGTGPGLGTAKETSLALKNLIKECNIPLVIDADGLNMISRDPEMISLLKPGTILTPHPKEFDRIAGESPNGFSRMKKQVDLSMKHEVIITLKGAHTSISLPDGSLYFNSTGNPGMATGGSGDVLTGMILSFLAQGYSAADAALLAVYVHGLAGDIAAEEISPESLIASDIINHIGKAFYRIRCYTDK